MELLGAHGILVHYVIIGGGGIIQSPGFRLLLQMESSGPGHVFLMDGNCWREGAALP